MLAKERVREEDLEPEIYPFRYYIDAFSELSTCRTGGMGVTPIPFTAIMEYCRLMVVDDADEFLYIIRRIDNFLLGMENDKQKRSK